MKYYNLFPFYYQISPKKFKFKKIKMKRMFLGIIGHFSNFKVILSNKFITNLKSKNNQSMLNIRAKHFIFNFN